MYSVNNNHEILVNILLMICNILYNLNYSENIVYLLEYEVYDMLLSKYNSEFNIVDSSSTNIFNHHNKINPIMMINTKDNLFSNILLSHNASNSYIIKNNPIIQTKYSYDNIYDTSNNYPMLINKHESAKFILCKDAKDKGVLDDNNIRILERDFFQRHIINGIISENEKIDMIIELKYDGISIDTYCTDMVISAKMINTANTQLVQDMTNILQGYTFPSAYKNKIAETIGHPLHIKFKAVILKDNLYIANKLGKIAYDNSCNIISNILNDSNSYKYRDYITLVPLEIDKSNIPSLKWTRELEIEFLNKYYTTHGCPLRYIKISGTYKECLYSIYKFMEEAEAAREYLNINYNGIIVSYMNNNIIDRLGIKNHTIQYSCTINFNPLKRQTHFLGYKYKIGQNGAIIPIAYYVPLEFNGIIYTKSSCNSYAKFKELCLRVNDVINVEYINYKTTKISKSDFEYNKHNKKTPIEEFITICPECGSKLVESINHKTMYCPNINCNGRKLARLNNMLNKLNIRNYDDTIISKLGINNLKDFINLPISKAIDILDVPNGEILIHTIQAIKENPIADYIVLGALGFTNIGQKTWKSICEYYTIKEIDSILNTNDINNIKEAFCFIKGIGDTIINTLLLEYPIFKDDIYTIIYNMNIYQTKNKNI